MSTIETGGPAFPMQEPQAIHAFAIAAVDGITNPDERDRAYIKARAEAVGGMTLRDHFATHCGALGDEVSMALAAELAATQGVAKPADSKDQMGWHRFWCAVHAAHRYMMADAMIAARKPEYDPARMASQALDDRATIAGLESAVSHLSALFDEFRALLVEVNDVCGRDGHGGPLEDGESEIIDRVRAALSMTEASAMLSARKGMS